MNTQLTPRLNKVENNIVIDGGMNYWPEGASRLVANNQNVYGSSMFKFNNGTSAINITNARSTLVPGSQSLIYSNLVSKTSAGTLSSNTAVNIAYFVEGYDVQPIFKQKWSLVFWVKSSVASNRSVSLQNASQSHSCVKQYTIASANVWQLVVLEFDALNTCPGVIERETLAGLKINFTQVAGSLYQTGTFGAWQSGILLSGTGEDSTWLTGTTHDFAITGVMVVPGEQTGLTPATYDYVRSGKTQQGEVARLMRYFEMSYDIASTIGAIAGSHLWWRPTAVDFHFSVDFAVAKRSTPSSQVYSPQDGAAARIYATDGAANRVASAINPTTKGVDLYSGANTVGQLTTAHWSADARF